MTTSCPPLPQTPVFPVLGLPEEQFGTAELSMWNAPTALYTVTVAYDTGDPIRPTFVITVSKAVTFGSGTSRGGLADVVAVIGGQLVDLKQLGPADAGAALRAWNERLPMGRDATIADLLADGWSRNRVDVGGRPSPGAALIRSGVAAIVVDGPAIAAGVVGPADRFPRQVALTDVRGQLGP